MALHLKPPDIQAELGPPCAGASARFGFRAALHLIHTTIIAAIRALRTFAS